jgi:hypothetical protein
MKFNSSIYHSGFVSFSAGAQKLHIKKENNGYWILENNQKIFFFQRTLNDSIPSHSRNNYFHPVYDLNNNCITEDYPSDHLHHRGIFWAWHQILVNDEPICDPWDIKNFYQNITEFEFSGDVNNNGVLKYTSFWHTVDNPDDPFILEKTVVSIYPKQRHYRRIDFTISLKALENNLSIGGSDNEKGYGGFTVRMKTDENTVFTNPKNDKIKPTNLAIQAGQFVDISNSKKKSGVTIISWSQNDGKENWILRESASAQNIAWPGREPIPLSSSENTTLKYSLIIHKGKRKRVPFDKILKTIN